MLGSRCKSVAFAAKNDPGSPNRAAQIDRGGARGDLVSLLQGALMPLGERRPVDARPRTRHRPHLLGLTDTSTFDIRDPWYKSVTFVANNDPGSPDRVAGQS